MYKKKLFGKILWMAGLMLVLCLMGCDTGGGDTGGGGGGTITYTGSDWDTTYQLTIIQNSAKAVYVPQAGDIYVLKIGNDLSQGTVAAFVEGTFFLNPNMATVVPFTVTVSGNDITAITGYITLVDGRTVKAPESITPGSAEDEPKGEADADADDPKGPGGPGPSPSAPGTDAEPATEASGTAGL